MTIDELIARLEKCSGPDRELDAEIIVAVINAKWVTKTGTLGGSWYELTDLGRTALTGKKDGME